VAGLLHQRRNSAYLPFPSSDLILPCVKTVV
jgi:hypothetical protein